MRQSQVGLRSIATIGVVWCLLAAVVGAAENASAPRRPWTTSKLQGSPVPPEPYAIVPAFPALRFEKPTSLEQVPGMNRLLVTQMSGKIHSFPNDPATSRADLVLDLIDLLPADLKGKGVSL